MKSTAGYSVEVLEQVFESGIKYIYIVRLKNEIVLTTIRFVKKKGA